MTHMTPPAKNSPFPPPFTVLVYRCFLLTFLLSVRKKCLSTRPVSPPRLPAANCRCFFCFVGNDFRLFPRLAAGECVGGWIERTRGNPAGLLLVREATARPSIVREITTVASVQAGKRFLTPQQHLEGGSNNSRGGFRR